MHDVERTVRTQTVRALAQCAAKQGAYEQVFPALVEALDNEDDLASIITHDTRTGLAFLPIGMADLRSLKTAQRKRLQTGLEQLSKMYDLVVIDGGGVLEDESSHIILPIAQEVILIAQAGETQAATLTAVSQQLDRARDKIAGVVLTGSHSSKI